MSVTGPVHYLITVLCCKVMARRYKLILFLAISLVCKINCTSSALSY